ncbi:7150_t:CDS:2 [Entrophospora sp. SA101]|nr:14637_t:CDS:2 [Entrophospora sp. SA101]CAJ0826850.1 7150_t:CDS:2 [Entrophospora sp. SA101]
MFKSFIRSPSPIRVPLLHSNRRISSNSTITSLSSKLSKTTNNNKINSRCLHQNVKNTNTTYASRIYKNTTSSNSIFNTTPIALSSSKNLNSSIRHPLSTTTKISYHFYSTTTVNNKQLNENKSAAKDVSEEIFASVPKVDVKKVLVVGSGGLSIGQAGEFDYSGSQAIKALRESDVHTVLVNPNIATIQTSHALADTVYFLPVTVEYLTYIIERERPDGILLTFGGQTGLNVGIKLEQMGVLSRLGVKVLGTPIRTLEVSEDRDLFAKALAEIDIPVAQSTAVNTVDDALKAAEEIGYPIIVRSAFALGGLGSGFANTPEELRSLSTKSLALSKQILVEKSMKGWKEVEYEVVRDAANNCITVCNMENFDPLGIHTGDSIVVAPSQTLSDQEYHMLRTAAIKIIRHLGVVGECNVQYALNPESLEFKVIEVNARLSRSSALASKATGYPLAFVAAKIALGHTLPELRNAVTKTTTACFEPSLDYIVTKIPRWDLSKFQHVRREIGSSMKSVGEVMAIGRTFEESLQKAIRQVDPSFKGFQSIPFNDLDNSLTIPTDRRLFAVGQAMIEKNYTIDQIHDLTKIDKWFLHKLGNIVNVQHELKHAGKLENISKELLQEAKKKGFSDAQIASFLEENVTEDQVRKARKDVGITPFVKRIDTLAAEFPAHTNYLYTTYNASTHDIDFNDHGSMVLGSGVYRIGSSVEFDWCGVSAIRAIRDMGKKTVMVNYNPETVSTDFDECDRLYFEELSYERVMDIYEQEKAENIVVSVGGQLPQNIALRLHQNNVNIMGTSPVMIDKAEDRYKFSKILDQIGVDQPEWKELTSAEEAEKFADKVGHEALHKNLSEATSVSPLHPVVITKFILGASEIDIDAVAYKGKLLVHAVSEHVENAGVHSGDATLVLPPRDISEETMENLKVIAQKVAKAFEITGPFNMQVIKKDEPDGGVELKVIECNLRASRSFPFVSKVLGVNFIDVATRALCDENVPEPIDLMKEKRDYQAVKVPQFSWTRLQGADPFLGVEMASTGEVACFGKDKYEAYWAAIQSTQNFRVPEPGSGILIGRDELTNDEDFFNVAYTLSKDLNHPLYTSSKQVTDWLNKRDIHATTLSLPVDDKKELQKAFKDNKIDFVFNLAQLRAPTINDENYIERRSAVDFGIPLVNDSKCAKLFVEALKRKRIEFSGLVDGKIPNEVKSWSDFIGGRHC